MAIVTDTSIKGFPNFNPKGEVFFIGKIKWQLVFFDSFSSTRNYQLRLEKIKYFHKKRETGDLF